MARLTARQVQTLRRPGRYTLRKIVGKVADSNRARLSPGEHKARDREHVVPLVPAALALLGSVRSLRRHDGDDALVFPSPQAGAGSLSAATVAGVMKSAGLAGAGSSRARRSTFVVA